jgi:hypothetical protein
MKGICMNSETRIIGFKGEEVQAKGIKKHTRQNNSRKYPKSQGKNAYPDTGGL